MEKDDIVLIADALRQHCIATPSCRGGCPFWTAYGCTLCSAEPCDWDFSNTRTTRRDAFLKHFPGAKMRNDALTPAACAGNVYGFDTCPTGGAHNAETCAKCWNAPAPDEYQGGD